MVIRETGASRASEIPVLLAPLIHRKWRIGRAIVHRKPKAVPKRICSVLSTLEIKSMGTVDLSAVISTSTALQSQCCYWIKAGRLMKVESDDHGPCVVQRVTEKKERNCINTYHRCFGDQSICTLIISRRSMDTLATMPCQGSLHIRISLALLNHN